MLLCKRGFGVNSSRKVIITVRKTQQAKQNMYSDMCEYTHMPIDGTGALHSAVEPRECETKHQTWFDSRFVDKLTLKRKGLFEDSPFNEGGRGVHISVRGTNLFKGSSLKIPHCNATADHAGFTLYIYYLYLLFLVC